MNMDRTADVTQNTGVVPAFSAGTRAPYRAESMSADDFASHLSKLVEASRDNARNDAASAADRNDPVRKDARDDDDDPVGTLIARASRDRQTEQPQEEQSASAAKDPDTAAADGTQTADELPGEDADDEVAALPAVTDEGGEAKAQDNALEAELQLAALIAGLQVQQQASPVQETAGSAEPEGTVSPDAIGAVTPATEQAQAAAMPDVPVTPAVAAAQAETGGTTGGASGTDAVAADDATDAAAPAQPKEETAAPAKEGHAARQETVAAETVATAVSGGDDAAARDNGQQQDPGDQAPARHAEKGASGTDNGAAADKPDAANGFAQHLASSAAKETSPSKEGTGAKHAAAAREEKVEETRPASKADAGQGIEMAAAVKSSTAGVQQSTMVDKSAATPAPTKAEETAFLDDLVQKMSLVSNNKRSEMTIQLKPDYLGKMNMQLVMEDNHLSAHVRVENQTVKNIIETNMAQLTDSLAGQGIKVDRFNVVVNDQNYTGDLRHQQFYGQQGQQQGHAGQYTPERSYSYGYERGEDGLRVDTAIPAAGRYMAGAARAAVNYLV